MWGGDWVAMMRRIGLQYNVMMEATVAMIRDYGNMLFVRLDYLLEVGQLR